MRITEEFNDNVDVYKVYLYIPQLWQRKRFVLTNCLFSPLFSSPSDPETGQQ